MRQEGTESGGSLEFFITIRKNHSIEADATSEHLGWADLEAARYLAAPASELHLPALTHHRLFYYARPPEKMDLEYEGVKRHVPPPAGSIMLTPAGSPTLSRWSGRVDVLLIYLSPRLVARVAADTFDLDLARAAVPPLDALDLPHLRAAMQLVEAELTADGAGGPLAAESIANVLAVHLIRHALAPRRTERSPDGLMPQTRLRAVVEYIEDHLDANPSLEQIAAIAQLSPYHFARQFKAATGMPPHKYVVTRRVERAKELLREGGDISLTSVAARVGFSDYGHFSRHFKRIVGVTPRRFRRP